MKVNVSAFGSHDARSKNRNDPREKRSTTTKTEDKDLLMKSNIEDDGFETVYPPLARAEILDKAKDAVTRDRAATHGDAENSFSQIAATWSWWLGERLDGQVDAYDVAMMMTLFKLARAKGNKHHLDNFVDASAYSALAGEMANRD